MGCANLPSKGVGAPHQCPLGVGSKLSLLLDADVCTHSNDDSTHSSRYIFFVIIMAAFSLIWWFGQRSWCAAGIRDLEMQVHIQNVEAILSNRTVNRESLTVEQYVCNNTSIPTI